MNDEEIDGLGERVPGGEAIDPESPAGIALEPENAVDAEVSRREGAFGDNSSEGDEAPIP